MAEDELAEVAVVGDQDAALPLRYGKNLLVGKTCGILTADPPGGVTVLNKPEDETRVVLWSRRKFIRSWAALLLAHVPRQPARSGGRL
jgi:hypothetical protein